MKHTFKSGFTLIELLIVIALIAVLAGAVIIALNPARQFQQARDSERWSHVSVLSNAIQQNIAENRGVWTCSEGAIPTSTTDIASVGGYDLCTCLVPNNLAALPVDPDTGSFTDCGTYTSDYTIMQATSTGRITITATPELASSISVTQ
jgi:prepilin-type N-terminal cleavage/methylation domain-containing protein